MRAYIQKAGGIFEAQVEYNDGEFVGRKTGFSEQDVRDQVKQAYGHPDNGLRILVLDN